MDTDASFEANLRNLEKTVKTLEAGDIGLDAALAQYETGIRLLSKCHALLDDAGRKVALLTGVEPDGSPTTSAFDATATFEAPSSSTRSADGLPF